MTLERITANGVDLSSLVWNVTDLAGLLRSPPRRGEDIDVPGRHGRLRSPFKLYDTVDYPLPMWVVGADPATGIAPSDVNDGGQAFQQRVDELMAVFGQETVTLDHTRADGSVRRAVCQVLEGLEPTRQLGGPIVGMFTVVLANPGAFWSETAAVTSSWSTATAAAVSLTQFAGITAPTDELTVTFTGPVSNPELAQLSTGIYVAYDDVIPAGYKLVVDTTLWRLTSGDGTAWTPSYGKLRHGGAPTGRWFQLFPQTGAPPSVTWSHTGGGSAAGSISGVRKFLTA